MKYATVCSGIEAPSVAWHSMGWNPIFFSEIERFPSSVLNHYYPHVPNLGDMTKINGNEYTGAINLICGGTPCQSFSVAGLRQGLKDPRGNLALHFVKLLDGIRPEWFIWENVPGVLSSNSGRDFGSFVGALGIIGYGWAYRILDAQYFGVSQRRRRVFVVGHISGDPRRAASVLFDGQSMFWNTGTRKKARAKTTGGLAESAGECGEYIIGTGQGNSEIICGQSNTLNCNHEAPIAFIPKVDTGNLCASEIVPSIDTGSPHGVCVFDLTQITSKENRSTISGGACPTLNCSGGHHALKSTSIRRLLPIEYERLQGFPDNYTKISEKTADAPRYKALGNSMAVPVIRWIGNRINENKE